MDAAGSVPGSEALISRWAMAGTLTRFYSPFDAGIGGG